MTPRVFVGTVLARRTLVLFGFFTFLCVAVLGATYVTSRYALKVYVQNQLDRIEWDVTLTQLLEVDKAPMLLDVLRQQPNVKRAESLVFLRAYLPEGITALADDQPMLVPWFVVLSSTDPELLPPAYRPKGGQTVFSLFGRKDFVENNLSRAGGARRFSFTGEVEQGGHDDSGAPSHIHVGKRELFSVPIADVVELDRGELNSWMLEKMGTIAFVPYVGAGLNMPYDPATLVLFDRILQAHVHEHGETDIHEEAGRYQPEIDHVIKIDRTGLISGWDLDGSKERLQKALDAIGKGLPYRSNLYLRSDTLVLLDQMLRTSRLIGVVSLLLAIPVIGIAWVFAANLVRFVVLNERRKIGLMRLRGLQGSVLSQVFLFAILIGGVLGGLAGLIVGVTAPLVIYEGWSAVIQVIRLENPLLAATFLGVGLAVALIMGGRLIGYIRKLTPREAAHRFAAASGSTDLRFGFLPAISLLIGVAIAVSWLSGFSLSDRFPRMRFVEQGLNLLAISLLIYGLAVLLATRHALVAGLVKLLAPLTRGRLQEFAAEQTARKPTRAAGVVLVASLATAIILAPSVASRSFTEKAIRGVKAQLASDANFTFDTLDESPDQVMPLTERVARLKKTVVPADEYLKKQPAVTSVDMLIRSLVPLYVPGYGYGGTPLFILDNPSSYLKDSYIEDALGQTAPLRTILERVGRGEVAVSPSVAEFWKLRVGDDVTIGFDEKKVPVRVKVAGIITALPGAPQRAVQERDVFLAAQTDYLGFLFNTEAFMVASLDNPALERINAIVPHISFLVKGGENITPVSIPGALRDARTLPEEVGRIREDMFIHMVEQNFSLYLIAGLAISLFAVATIFIVNFIEDRRTLGLLRVRGAAPADLKGALVVQLYSPLLLGLLVGVGTGIGAGYGIARQIWSLRRIPTIIDQLSSRVALSWGMFGFAALIMIVLSSFVSLLGLWTFRKTAREAIYQE
jgi:hypothetical protein